MLRHGSWKALAAVRRWQSSSPAVFSALQQLSSSYDLRELQPSVSLVLSRGSARAADPDSDDDLYEPSERVKKLAEDIMHLNLLEVADLTGILEKRLGPSQQMPNFGMMPMGMMPQQGLAAPGGQAAAAPAAPVEEKTEFDVKLEGFEAAAKIKVIKEVRAVTELGLKEAKELVEKSPIVIKSAMKKEEAEALKKKLEGVGGKVVLE